MAENASEIGPAGHGFFDTFMRYIYDARALKRANRNGGYLPQSVWAKIVDGARPLANDENALKDYLEQAIGDAERIHCPKWIGRRPMARSA